jgi:hypothetical protein
MIPARQPSLSPAQRAFIEGAEALGATTPAEARGIGDLPRLASGELDELVQAGLVREAEDWRYYVFRPRNAPQSSAAESEPNTGAQVQSPTRTRFLKTLFFWLLLVLIPVLLLKLTAVR